MNAPRKILRGFFYTIASGYGARLGSLVLTLAIKRALGPGVFDHVLEGTIIFLMLSTFGQFGQVYALLHYEKEARGQLGEFLQTHFTLNLMAGAVILVISGVVAFAIYDPTDDSAGWTAIVIGTFAGLRFLRTLSMTSEGLMRVGLQFGRLSLLHGVGTIAALGVALLAAIRGWGEWSLLLGGWTTYSTFSLVYVILFCAGVWSSRPVAPWKLRLHPEWTKRLVNYGLWLWLAWVLQTFVWYYGWLVMKHMVGVRELTLYEHAWWFMQIPTAFISHIIFNYTNTLYARYQNDRARLGDLFSRMLGLIVRVSAPLALLFLMNAAAVVTLTGAQWAGASKILVWLGLYAFVRPLIDEGHSLLWAIGATRRTASVMVVLALVAAPLVPIAAASMGVRGIAYAMGVLAAVGAIGMLIAVHGQVHVAWRKVFLAPVVALGSMALAGCSYGLLGFDVEGELWTQAVRGTVMVLIYGAVLAAFDRAVIRENFDDVRRILTGPTADQEAESEQR